MSDPYKMLSDLYRSAFNTSNEVVSSLKAELERCLISNRQKRAQVMELKDELKTLKKDSAEYKQRCEQAELLSQEQKVGYSSIFSSTARSAKELL